MRTQLKKTALRLAGLLGIFASFVASMYLYFYHGVILLDIVLFYAAVLLNGYLFAKAESLK